MGCHGSLVRESFEHGFASCSSARRPGSPKCTSVAPYADALRGAGSETPKPTAPPAAAPPAAPPRRRDPRSREELAGCSVRELKDLLRACGGDPGAYLEKADLLDAACAALEGLRPGAPEATRSQDGCTGAPDGPEGSETIEPGDAEEPSEEERDASEEEEGQSAGPPAPDISATLGTDVADAGEAVRGHCHSAVAAASARLDRIWAELLLEAKRGESHSTVSAAIEARNVFGLIDAALELKREGAPVCRKVQHLAFEASVAEESWLVRRSIASAVERGDADDIELWVEQARAGGEDVSVETAYAELLRWKAAGDEGVGRARERSPEAEVGGDEGIRPPRTSAPGHCARESAQAQESDADTVGFSMRRVSAPYCAASGDLGRHGREHLRPSSAPSGGRYDGFWGGAGGFSFEASASSYAFSPGQLPAAARQEATASGPRYSDFWGAGSAEGAGAARAGGAERGTGYSYMQGDLRGDDLKSGAPRFPGFWAAGPKPAEPPPRPGGASWKIPEKPPPRPAPPADDAPGAAPRAEDAGPPPRRPATAGPSRPAPPTDDAPGAAPPRPGGASGRTPPPRPAPPADDAPGRAEEAAPPPRRPATAGPSRACAAEGRTTWRSEAPRGRQRDFSEAQCTRRAAGTGGRRVRLIDFLSAKANEPSFANAGGYRIKREPPPQRPASPPPQRPASPPPPPPPPRMPEQPMPPPGSPRREAGEGYRRWPWERSPSATDPAGRQRPAEATSSAPRAEAARSWRRKAASSVGAASERFYGSRERAKEDWERAKKDAERQAAEERRQREEWKRRREQDFWEEQSKTRGEERPPPPPPPPPPTPPPSGWRTGATRGSGPQSSSSHRAAPPRATPNSRAANLELLGFGPSAAPTEEELKKAYRAMAMRWHPDRPQNRERATEATQRFQAAKEAYDYFMEEHRRRA